MTTALEYGRTGRQREALRVVFPSVHQGPHALLLERLGISRSSRCECTPDECFNPPLELFLQVLDGRFRLFALMRVRFASKVGKTLKNRRTFALFTTTFS